MSKREFELENNQEAISDAEKRRIDGDDARTSVANAPEARGDASSPVDTGPAVLEDGIAPPLDPQSSFIEKFWARECSKESFLNALLIQPITMGLDARLFTWKQFEWIVFQKMHTARLRKDIDDKLARFVGYGVDNRDEADKLGEALHLYAEALRDVETIRQLGGDTWSTGSNWNESFKAVLDWLLRSFVATFCAGALVGPMLIMALIPKKWVILTTTCIAIFLFASLLSLLLPRGTQDIITVTAAYAAVLVIFVGATLPRVD